MQINPQTVFPFRKRIGTEFLHKQIRSGQTETVNALLHISHHENIIHAVLYSGHRGQQFFLHQITVLILVNHNLCKLPGQFFGCVGPLISFWCVMYQNFQGIVLQIRKIQDVLFLFFLPVALHKAQGQIHQNAHPALLPF